MGRLIHSVIASLDGYTVDADGGFEWAMPSEEVIAVLTEQTSTVSTFLYGRRMYETMAVWETDPSTADQSDESARWAEAWLATDKVVYSTTLADVWTERTRLARRFDVDEVRALKESADGDLTAEGPTLAAQALRLGLVDLIDVVLVPVVVGGGTPYLPSGLKLDLQLWDQRRFANGMVQLRYAVQ
ncbi:dihydrofolate reductase family protein [Aeromicrobium sp. CF4.19]|uniref:dihydrofolate reductase family protein n=1 Tax=Aeromicrobium sp. CF4.19 TaxID=3373082 RepID=UPI003EE488FE